MRDSQREYVWAHPDEKPKRRRAWLIVVLAVVAVAVAIAVVVFWLFLRSDAPLAQSTSTSTPRPSPSVVETATPTPTASSTPQGSPAPIDTPPPAPDPSIEAFRDQVSGWLDDAFTGLDIVSTSSGQDAVPVVDNLRGDAQRLAGVPAPSSIAVDWGRRVSNYSDRLTELRQAVSSGAAAPVDAARAAAQSLRDLVGA